MVSIILNENYNPLQSNILLVLMYYNLQGQKKIKKYNQVVNLKLFIILVFQFKNIVSHSIYIKI